MLGKNYIFTVGKIIYAWNSVKYFGDKAPVTINFCQDKMGKFSRFGPLQRHVVRPCGYIKWKLCPTTGWNALFYKKPTNSGTYLTLSILNLRIKHEPTSGSAHRHSCDIGAFASGDDGGGCGGSEMDGGLVLW